MTGLLIYADKYYFQIREGQKKIVSQLLENISNDKRNFDVQKLGKTDIDIFTTLAGTWLI